MLHNYIKKLHYSHNNYCLELITNVMQPFITVFTRVSPTSILMQYKAS